jgi:hypothetical protein
MNDASERARGSDDDVAWLLCVLGCECRRRGGRVRGVT